MEGKEVRFDIAPSALFATVTTDAGGAVDAMHDSFLPLGGMVLIVNMALGEVTFGGVGSGLYGMLAFAIVTMFVAGLMVGRTPEYLGKKLEAREVKLTMLALLSYSLSILGWTALAAVVPQGVAGIANAGPHGFSEILYAFASATGNNGSSFAGLSTNTMFYNMTLAAAMAMGRFIYVIPLLAVAGSLAQKKRLAPSAGSVPTHSPQFVGLLVGVVLIMGGLAYFPTLSLGPVTEPGGDESRYTLSGSLIIRRRGSPRRYESLIHATAKAATTSARISKSDIAFLNLHLRRRQPVAKFSAPVIKCPCRKESTGISAPIYKFYRLSFFSDRLSDSYSLFTRLRSFYSLCRYTSGEITC